jgi:hypothetical protein
MMNSTANGTVPLKQLATTPVLVNNNKYYFDRDNFPQSSSNKRCAARLSELITDIVPFDTSIRFLGQTSTAPTDASKNNTLKFTYSSVTAFFDVSFYGYFVIILAFDF